MLLDKYIKPKPSVESADIVVPVTTDVVDPVVVDAVQADAVAAIDNATAVVEPAVVVDPVAAVEPVVDTLPPVETELPPANTEVVATAMATEPVVDASVVSPTEVTVSVEDDAAPAKPEDVPVEGDPEADKGADAPAEGEVASVPAEVTAEVPVAAPEANDAPAEPAAVDAPVAADPEPAPAADVPAEAPVETSEPASDAPVDAPAPETSEEPTATEPAPADPVASAPVEGSEEPVAEPAAAEAPAEPAATETTEAPEEAPVASDAPAEAATDDTPSDPAPAVSEEPVSDAPESSDPVATTDAGETSDPAPAAGATDDTAADPAPSEDEQIAEKAAEVEAEVSPENVETLVQEAEEADDEYADEMLELNGLAREDEELRASIESLEERADALQNFQTVLIDAQANEEPISPEAAGVMGEAIAHQTEGLIETNPIPSMESFQGRSGSARSIVASLEGVGAAIDTVWKWIVAAIRKLIDLGGQLWRKLMDDSARIQSRAENLKELVEAVDDSGMKSNATVAVSPTVGARLSVGGKPVGRRLVQSINTINDYANSIIVDFDASALRRAEIFAEGLGHVVLTDLENTLPRLPSVMKVPRGMKRVGVSDDGMMEELESGTGLLNDAKIKVMIPSVKAGTGLISWTQRAYAAVQVADRPGIVMHQEGSTVAMPVLSVEECNDVLNSVIALAKLSRKFRGQYDTVERTKLTFIKAGQDFADKHAGESEPENINRVKVIVRCLHDYAKDVGTGSTQIVAYALRCSDASLRYVTACVDHLRNTEPKGKGRKDSDTDAE